MALTNWPFSPAQVKIALGVKPSEQQPSDDDLELWAAFVTELIDARTGRDEDPTRHVLTAADGVTQSLPVAFVMAARVTARLLWRQEKNGSTRTEGGLPGAPEVPAGADMPAKAKVWLQHYPPTPGIA